MTKPLLKDPVASIRQRLLNYAKAHDDNFQRILTRYAIERLLFRLSQTDARDGYVLKGAMLFVAWPEHAFRPTGDLDLLAWGDPAPEAITELFAQICRVDAREDGLIFDPDSLVVEAVREGAKYQGARLMLRARLSTAVIPVQVDIGFGDNVYPSPRRRSFPGLLPELPAADILMYPPETVVAEKFEAMIRFAEETGRIKDFHDIWVISRTFEFDLSVLTEAVGGTLRRRQTATPAEMPVVLRAPFAERSDKQALWAGFLRRTPPASPPPALDELLAELRGFLGPVLAALALPESARGHWNPSRRAWE